MRFMSIYIFLIMTLVFFSVFSVRCLLTWYDSVRTRYGKLVARPSGSGAELTDREKWILDNLKFLKPYIHRVKKKTPVSVSIMQITECSYSMFIQAENVKIF